MSELYGELYRCSTEIDEAIMEYRSNNAKDPEYLVLPMAHRQALKINFAHVTNKEVYEIKDVTSYAGIKVLKKEEVIIVQEEQRK